MSAVWGVSNLTGVWRHFGDGQTRKSPFRDISLRGSLIFLMNAAQAESAGLICSWLVANETRGSAPGHLNIHFFQKCGNSQLIRVAFTLRRRCEDTRGQLCLHGRCSLGLRQDDRRLL